jgi:hypothetical protein
MTAATGIEIGTGASPTVGLSKAPGAALGLLPAGRPVSVISSTPLTVQQDFRSGWQSLLIELGSGLASASELLSDGSAQAGKQALSPSTAATINASLRASLAAKSVPSTKTSAVQQSNPVLPNLAAAGGQAGRKGVPQAASSLDPAEALSSATSLATMNASADAKRPLEPVKQEGKKPAPRSNNEMTSGFSGINLTASPLAVEIAPQVLSTTTSAATAPPLQAPPFKVVSGGQGALSGTSQTAQRVQKPVDSVGSEVQNGPASPASPVLPATPFLPASNESALSRATLRASSLPEAGVAASAIPSTPVADAASIGSALSSPVSAEAVMPSQNQIQANKPGGSASSLPEAGVAASAIPSTPVADAASIGSALSSPVSAEAVMPSQNQIQANMPGGSASFTSSSHADSAVARPLSAVAPAPLENSDVAALNPMAKVTLPAAAASLGAAQPLIAAQPLAAGGERTAVGGVARIARKAGEANSPQREAVAAPGQSPELAVATSGLIQGLAGVQGVAGEAIGSNGSAHAVAEPDSAETFAAMDASAGPGRPAWIHAGAQQAEAGFQDPALGWVSVRADSSGSGIHAELVAGSNDAAQVLSGHMAGLNAFLTEHHTPVETLTLSSPGGGGSGGSGGAELGAGMQQGSGRQGGQQTPQGSDAGSTAEPTFLSAVQNKAASQTMAWSAGVDAGSPRGAWVGGRISVMA